MPVRPAMRWFTALSYFAIALSPMLAVLPAGSLPEVGQFYIWAWLGGLFFGGSLGVYGIIRPSIGWELIGIVSLLTCYIALLTVVAYLLITGMVREISAELFALSTLLALGLLLARRFAELLILLRSSREGTPK